MSENRAALRARFIVPAKDQAAPLPKRNFCKVPLGDGYYWLEWPDRCKPETGHGHMEICEVRNRRVRLIGGPDNYDVKGYGFKFYGPLMFEQPST